MFLGCLSVIASVRPYKGVHPVSTISTSSQNSVHGISPNLAR